MLFLLISTTFAKTKTIKLSQFETNSLRIDALSIGDVLNIEANENISTGYIWTLIDDFNRDPNKPLYKIITDISKNFQTPSTGKTN